MDVTAREERISFITAMHLVALLHNKSKRTYRCSSNSHSLHHCSMLYTFVTQRR
jgi:hypothetical protein